jgi:hypothetical protein
MDQITRKKIGLVHKYLEVEFPESNIRIGFDYDRMAPKFQLFWEDKTCCMIINKEFFSNHQTKEINNWLLTSKLSEALADHANSTTSIDSEGNLTHT